MCACVYLCLLYLYLHLYLYLYIVYAAAAVVVLFMFFLCRATGLPNASSSRAIIIDTPQVVSSGKPPSPSSPLPYCRRLFTFVIVAVVLNLASYCLPVSLAVPVRVPSRPFSAPSIKEDHKKNRKQWATRATRGGNCGWGQGQEQGLGLRRRYVAVTLSGRFHTDTGRQQQQQQQLYKSQTCDCLASSKGRSCLRPDPSARPGQARPDQSKSQVHSSRFPFLLLLAQRYPVWQCLPRRGISTGNP